MEQKCSICIFLGIEINTTFLFIDFFFWGLLHCAVCPLVTIFFKVFHSHNTVLLLHFSCVIESCFSIPVVRLLLSLNYFVMQRNYIRIKDILYEAARSKWPPDLCKYSSVLTICLDNYISSVLFSFVVLFFARYLNSCSLFASYIMVCTCWEPEISFL